MSLDALAKYLMEVESAIGKLDQAYIERYEEEHLTSERLNLRIRIRFESGHLLELNEAVLAELSSITHLGYRYHFQGEVNQLVFRYDNSPHFPELPLFPNHKHLRDATVPVNKPDVQLVIDEAMEIIKAAK
jgi:hypothetical protein